MYDLISVSSYFWGPEGECSYCYRNIHYVTIDEGFSLQLDGLPLHT